MTGILILALIVLAVRIVYLEFTRHDQEESLESYRILVLEWYLYLHNKEHSEDFEMWRAELNDHDE
jgi:hypothetical protein